MTNNSKNALILSGCAVLLVSALIAIRFLPDKKDSSELELDTQSLNIINEPIDKITTVDVMNSYGTYTFAKNSKDKLTLPELSKYKLSDHAINDLCDRLKNFTVEKVVSNELSHLEIYGLLSPEVQITINYNNNLKSSLSIGNMAPGGAGYYVLKQDKPNVYLVSSEVVAPFFKSKLDYISLSLTSPSSEDTPMSNLDYIELINTVKQTETKIIKSANPDDADKPIYKISSPIDKIIEEENNYKIESIENISAQKVECINALEEDIDSYGLRDPKIKLNIKYKNKDMITLFLSPADRNNDYFVIEQDEDIIYRVSNSDLEFLDILSGSLETEEEPPVLEKIN